MRINEILLQQLYLYNIRGNVPQETENYIIQNKLIIYDIIQNVNFSDHNYYPYDNFEWRYNEANVRTPFFNGERKSMIKLHDDNQIYNYISTNIFIQDEDLICGENIQALADVFLGKQSSIDWNPNNRQFSKEIVNIENDIGNHDNFLRNHKVLFVCTHDKEAVYEKFRNNDVSNNILITHNSDNEINQEHLFEISRFKKQLSQNCRIRHDKLTSIPIGIENRQWFNHSIFHNVRRNPIIKTKHIYFNFSIGTSIFSRQNCYDKLINKIPWSERVPKEQYFEELKRHKYAICPRGNGLDTHRVWECLYLDVIPIMLRSETLNIDNLPIIYLNDWNELDPNNLTNSFYNIQINKLTMNFYKDQINI